MAYTNSSNWRDEAELRNQRKAKADSMSALLDHVNWNPDTLEIKFEGVTLNWGDIEGEIDGKEYDGESLFTKITKDTISTTYIVADSVAADNITTASIWGRTFGFDFSILNGFSIGYVGDVEDYEARLRVGKDEDGYGQVFIESQGIVLDANRRIDLWATSGAYINGDSIITSGSISSYLSPYFRKPTSSAGTFFRPVGFTNSAMTSVGYMTKGDMQSWLGIESK